MDVFALLQKWHTEPPVQQANLRRQLADLLNQLVAEDFGRLVQLLYRVDVSEKKVKAALAERPQEDAGLVLADLLLEREEEKRRQRLSCNHPPGNSMEERW